MSWDTAFPEIIAATVAAAADDAHLRVGNLIAVADGTDADQRLLHRRTGGVVDMHDAPVRMAAFTSEVVTQGGFVLTGEGYAADDANALFNPDFLASVSDAFLMPSVHETVTHTPALQEPDAFAEPGLYDLEISGGDERGRRGRAGAGPDLGRRPQRHADR